jgi:hypothetical protein
MNYEAKRDVLVNAVDALADAQASSDNNVGLGHQDADLFMAEYDAALPDDLPVIPKEVGDVIKIHKEYAHSLLDIFGSLSIYGVSRTDPAQDYNAWIVHHPDTFARAWVLGIWRVEETGEIVKLEVKY